MKNQIVIAALALGAFVFGINNAQAQTGTPSNPVSTNVNLILSDVISIDEGSVASDGVVDFNYVTTTDYNNAKNVTVPNSLIVTSSKNFSIKVKAEGANFSDGTNNIPVDVMRIKVASGGSMVTFSPSNGIELSDVDQTLVSTAFLGAQKSLSLDYSISAEKAQTVLLGKPAGTYTQQVTYTAIAL